MQANPPELVDTTTLVNLLIAEIGEDAIRQSTPSYSRSIDFSRIRSGFEALLEECRATGGTWSEVIDRFEDKGQVSLMTVHKSKGLEFHTMIFFGLDNQSWWSLAPQNEEELNSFFVAFTRAEQRAFFTCCIERGADRLVGEYPWQLRIPTAPSEGMKGAFALNVRSWRKADKFNVSELAEGT